MSKLPRRLEPSPVLLDLLEFIERVNADLKEEALLMAILMAKRHGLGMLRPTLADGRLFIRNIDLKDVERDEE